MQEQLTVWTDEADLLRRAAAPRVEWFPVPRRAQAMQPLVWLLALVPILFVMVRTPWTEDAARWGLRSLKLLSADEWSEFLDPGDIGQNGALAYEPPLMTWCTAAAIWGAGSSQPLAVIFPAAVCAFVIVVAGYKLARTLGGPWLGLLTAILLATHPITQQLVQQPTAATMGLALATISLWSLLRHLESGPRIWSPWLILGSITWGLCLLSSGPLAVVTLGIVVMFLATAPKCGATGRRIIPLNRKAGCVDWRQWKSLVIWCSLGLLVGGWWPLMMGSLHGSEFWRVWFGLSVKSSSTPVLTPEVERWVEGSKIWFRHSAALLPLLSGFVLLGVYRMVRIVFFNDDPAQRRTQHFLLVLTLVAGSMWGLSVTGIEWSLFQRPLWTAFLLIPLSILAAGGLLEIGERQAGFGLTLGAYGCGVLVAVWRYRGYWLDASKFSHQLALIVSLGILFGASLWLTLRFIHGHELRQRWLVRGGIWGLLLAHCVWGVNFLSVGPLAVDSSAEQPLLQFWSDLRAWRATQKPSAPGDELVLLTARAPSSRLQYIVQSVWPRRMLKFAANWDDLALRRSGLKSKIIVTYGKREILLPNTPGELAAPVPIVPPRIYDKAELTAYELKPEPVEPELPNPS